MLAVFLSTPLSPGPTQAESPTPRTLLDTWKGVHSDSCHSGISLSTAIPNHTHPTSSPETWESLCPPFSVSHRPTQCDLPPVTSTTLDCSHPWSPSGCKLSPPLCHSHQPSAPSRGAPVPPLTVVFLPSSRDCSVQSSEGSWQTVSLAQESLSSLSSSYPGSFPVCRLRRNPSLGLQGLPWASRALHTPDPGTASTSGEISQAYGQKAACECHM